MQTFSKSGSVHLFLRGCQFCEHENKQLNQWIQSSGVMAVKCLVHIFTLAACRGLFLDPALLESMALIHV